MYSFGDMSFSKASSGFRYQAAHTQIYPLYKEELRYALRAPLVNIVKTGGLCRLLEVVESKSVQWFVCQFYGNELNLRETFRVLDGGTTGPKSFTNPLGKATADDVQEPPVARFQPVSGHVMPLPDAVAHELSSDQKLLYQVPAGNLCAESFGSGNIASKKIGPVNHARWLTLGARLVRSYISTVSPGRKLNDILQWFTW